MDNFIQKRILQEAMQLHNLQICNELKLFFKFNFCCGKSWNLFYDSVLINMNFKNLIESKINRRCAFRNFIQITKFPSFV